MRQQRIEQGLKSGALTTREASKLEKEEAKVDRMESRALKNGNVIVGPALIEEHASTTVVQPGDTVQVDLYGNLQISIGSDRS